MNKEKTEKIKEKEFNTELKRVIKDLREKLKASQKVEKIESQNIQIQNLNNLYQSNSFYVESSKFGEL
jgi:molybdopterin converting factor small subunit